MGCKKSPIWGTFPIAVGRLSGKPACAFHNLNKREVFCCACIVCVEFSQPNAQGIASFTRTKVTKPLLANRKLTIDFKSVATSNSVCDIQAFTIDEKYRSRILTR